MPGASPLNAADTATGASPLAIIAGAVGTVEPYAVVGPYCTLLTLTALPRGLTRPPWLIDPGTALSTP